ncbi:MAG: SxtJ family membrane protein [Beijerinckiaceae bacterium]
MTQADPRKFGFAFGLGLAALGTVALTRAAPAWEWGGLWFVAATLLVIGLLRPSWLAAPAKWWMTLGEILGRIVSPIVWAVIYVACFAPIGLALRLLKRDALHLAFDETAQSYWISRDPADAPATSLKRQF